MPLPSERLDAATRRAAASAALRLVAVWIGTGVLHLAATGAQWLIVETTSPGDGSSALGLLTGWVHAASGGDAWLLYFVLVTIALVAAEAAALAWAVRADGASPLLLLAIGGAGLVARVAGFAASTAIPARLARGGIEALAAYNVVSAMAWSTYQALHWLVLAALLVVLVARVLRAPRLAERDGPYREAAA